MACRKYLVIHNVNIQLLQDLNKSDHVLLSLYHQDCTEQVSVRVSQNHLLNGLTLPFVLMTCLESYYNFVIRSTNSSM